MENSTLDSIFNECPRFRILTSGKSGVGKTTLIKHTFNIESLKASDKEPGQCNIEDEISSSENDRFVLHDSQGFEAGEADNFNKVKAFIHNRSQEPLVRDRIHAVWLCLQIPSVGARLIEAGDEEFLKLPFGDLPVVIVFTQYDRLYDQLSYDLAGKLQNLDPEQRGQFIEEESKKYYQQHCVDQLRKIKHLPKRLKWLWVSNQKEYHQSFEELVSVTLDLVRNHVRESVWIVSAAAQRVNADANVESCIEVGIRKYWRGLAAGTYFANRRLDACIGVIHNDIVGIWNFRDDDKILQGKSFKEAVYVLVQDLADPNGQGPGSYAITKLQNIKAVIDVATPLSGPLAPVVASAGLSVMFVKWLSEMYSSTPGVLRCLMGYIVNVTIVLEVLFWFKIAQPRLPSLSQEDIDAAFGLYRGSASHVEVHAEIRKYVDNMKLLDHVNPDDKTHLEVKRLINAHRRVLISAILADSANLEKESDSTEEGAESLPAVVEMQSPPNDTTQPPEAGPSSVVHCPPDPSRQSQPVSKHPNTKMEGSTPTSKKKPRFFGFFRKKPSGSPS